MAKAAAKKKATTAHRKVQSSTVRSRKSTKRTSEKSVEQPLAMESIEAPEKMVATENTETSGEVKVNLKNSDENAPAMAMPSLELETKSEQNLSNQPISKFNLDVPPAMLESQIEQIQAAQPEANQVAQIEMRQAAQAEPSVQASDPVEQVLNNVVKSDLDKTKQKRKPHHHKKSHQRVNFGFKRVILALVFAAAAVFAIVYFVNLNSPDISLKVAAMQSGIDAKYPGYVPRDFNLSDITSENGKITLNFYNSSTGDAFSIVEEKSSWDTAALYENYVKVTYGSNYTLIKDQEDTRGLALYISGSDACWVNGGVVYKLDTTAGSLTKKQIKAIAVSL